MSTEDDLRARLRPTGDWPEAEVLLLGLADRALEQAARPTRRRRAAYAGAAAIATAGVSVSVFAAAGRSPRPAVVSVAPQVPRLAVALIRAECYGSVKLKPYYGWDATSKSYQPMAVEPGVSLDLSPDGAPRVLVTKSNMPGSADWAVTDWSQAVSGKGFDFHSRPIAAATGWTPDGRKLVSGPHQVIYVGGPGGYLAEGSVDFIDPGTGATESVPTPATVNESFKGKEHWWLGSWTGNKDSLTFVLLSYRGDTVKLVDAQGRTLRTVKLKTGGFKVADPLSQIPDASLSPSGRYLLAQAGNRSAVFDLNDRGKKLFDTGTDPASFGTFAGWSPDDQIMTYTSSSSQPGSMSGWSTAVQRRSVNGEVVGEAPLRLPDDPTGECSLTPDLGSVGAFPGAPTP